MNIIASNTPAQSSISSQIIISFSMGQMLPDHDEHDCHAPDTTIALGDRRIADAMASYAYTRQVISHRSAWDCVMPLAASTASLSATT